MEDNGGTRSGFDRREFQYTAHIPERRSQHDRRNGLDRRKKISKKRRFDRRNSHNLYGSYPIERKDYCWIQT